MPDDVARVAKMLSKPQRAAMLWLPADGSSRAIVKGSPSQVCFYALQEKTKGDPRKELARICRLTERTNSYHPVNGKWPDPEYRLTPLGLAVRAHLEGEAS